ncbi:hypothetical protein [Imhoffiella purpurea]|uniref:hypothetical protein n=1 Tax=Imhoffiella purpurea TaxID=1249627 RepID=UPI0012FE0CA6|nr:hypothetical protein [Imhoffiella purpurea]
MMDQHCHATQALAAVVRELDDRLTNTPSDGLAAQHNHLTWLSTAASILADIAVEQVGRTEDTRAEITLT